MEDPNCRLEAKHDCVLGKLLVLQLLQDASLACNARSDMRCSLSLDEEDNASLHGLHGLLLMDTCANSTLEMVLQNLLQAIVQARIADLTRRSALRRAGTATFSSWVPVASSLNSG